jgi:hypothetical protein
MDGDVAALKVSAKLAEHYDAMIYLDEVHAVGMYGHGARAACRDRRGRRLGLAAAGFDVLQFQLAADERQQRQMFSRLSSSASSFRCSASKADIFWSTV